eukprot:6664452-Prymnesium_polylepis.2
MSVTSLKIHPKGGGEPPSTTIRRLPIRLVTMSVHRRAQRDFSRTFSPNAPETRKIFWPAGAKKRRRKRARTISYWFSPKPLVCIGLPLEGMCSSGIRTDTTQEFEVMYHCVTDFFSGACRKEHSIALEKKLPIIAVHEKDAKKEEYRSSRFVLIACRIVATLGHCSITVSKSSPGIASRNFSS